MGAFNTAVASILINTVGMRDTPLQRYTLPPSLFNFGALPKTREKVRSCLLRCFHTFVVCDDALHLVKHASRRTVSWGFNYREFAKNRSGARIDTVMVPPDTTPLFCCACGGAISPSGCYAVSNGHGQAPVYACYPCFTCAPDKLRASASHCVYADPDRHIEDLLSSEDEVLVMLLCAKVTAAPSCRTSMLVETKCGLRFFVENTSGSFQVVSPHYRYPEFKKYPCPVIQTQGTVYCFW
jgi:hypothetical protein